MFCLSPALLLLMLATRRKGSQIPINATRRRREGGEDLLLLNEICTLRFHAQNPAELLFYGLNYSGVWRINLAKKLEAGANRILSGICVGFWNSTYMIGKAFLWLILGTTKRNLEFGCYRRGLMRFIPLNLHKCAREWERKVLNAKLENFVEEGETMQCQWLHCMLENIGKGTFSEIENVERVTLFPCLFLYSFLPHDDNCNFLISSCLPSLSSSSSISYPIPNLFYDKDPTRWPNSPFCRRIPFFLNLSV